VSEPTCKVPRQLSSKDIRSMGISCSVSVGLLSFVSLSHHWSVSAVTAMKLSPYNKCQATSCPIHRTARLMSVIKRRNGSMCLLRQQWTSQRSSSHRDFACRFALLHAFLYQDCHANGPAMHPFHCLPSICAQQSQPYVLIIYVQPYSCIV
jgi:hypothetical protein